MALTNVLIALLLDPPFSGQPLRLDGVPASRITHAPIRRRHDPDASADVLPPPVFARQGLERPHHPRHLVEGEGQDAARALWRQPGAQLADSLRNEHHESLVSCLTVITECWLSRQTR